MSRRATLTIKYNTRPVPPPAVEPMLLLAAVNSVVVDRYYSAYGWAVGPRSTTSSMANLCAVAIGKAGTIEELNAKSAANATDNLQIWKLYINGADTGEQIHIPLGSNSDSVTGLAIAVAPTDEIGWHIIAGGDGSAAPIDLSIQITLS